MSSFTQCIGEVLIGVTEDRCRLVFHFENGKNVEVYPHGPDSELKTEPWHQPGCVRRMAASGHCSCITRTKGPTK